MADWHAILYCPERVPAQIGTTLEHWKDRMPNIGTESLFHFWKLASQAGKTVWYVLVDDSVAGRVRNYITSNPALGIKFWYGRTARLAWADCYKDQGTDAVARAICRALLKYPVPTQVTDEGGTRTVDVPTPLGAAITAGVTIDPQVLADYASAIPMEVWDGS